MKKRGGFTYVEILVSFALFSILLASSLLLIGQAGRNLAAARTGYDAHLAAQSIMLAARDGQLLSGYAESYRVWINGTQIHSPCAPEVSLNVIGFDELNISGSSTLIIAAVFNEHGYIIGRAIGVTSP